MWKIALMLACASISLDSYASAQQQTRLIAMASPEVFDSSPSVLQNRFFTKALRLEAGLSTGMIVNESYSQTHVLGARVGLFLSEKNGFEYTHAKLNSKDSPDLLALRTQEVCVERQCRSLEPSFIRLAKIQQLQWVTAPVYGKINLFDWAILYSDLTLSLGGAQVETTQGRKWAFTPGIGQRFYFSKSFSLRIDATDVYLKETVTQGSASLGQWRHNWVAQLGLSAFLNSGE